MAITQDTFKKLYTKNKESLITEEEAITIDLTKTFFSWIKEKLRARELIVIQVRGEVRSGKSTAGIKIAYEINKAIEELKIKSNATDFMWRWIFSDQIEFLRFVNSDERNICLCIDEFSTLAKTGANSTTEEALFDHYSDVFAGQYLNRVCMGTDVIIDKNTTIILDTIGKDKDNGITMCKLMYRDIVTKQTLTLGHVKVDTSDIIKNWIGKGIRKIVETDGIENSSIKDNEKVEYYSKKDFYVKYQVRKYKRMQLVKREGVRDLRELEFSDLILESLEELEEPSKIKAVKRELIIVIVDEIIRKNKRIYSLITKQDIATKVSAILSINTEINLMYRRRNKSNNQIEITIYDKAIKKLQDTLEKRMDEQRKLRRLYKEYLEVESQ